MILIKNYISLKWIYNIHVLVSLRFEICLHCSTKYQFPYHWCLLVLGCLPINLCFSTCIRKTFFFSNLQTYLQKFRGALILTLIQSIWIVSWRPWILPIFIVHDYMYLYCLPLAAKGRPRSMNITFVSISPTVQNPWYQ